MKGTRGFVFAVEAMFALFLFAIVLVTATFLSAQEERDPYLKLNAGRAGNDVLAVLDHTGALYSGNATLIAEVMEDALPGNLDARLVVNTYYREEDGFNLADVSQYGNATPDFTSVYAVRRDAVALGNGRVSNYTIARLEVWQKK